MRTGSEDEDAASPAADRKTCGDNLAIRSNRAFGSSRISRGRRGNGMSGFLRRVFFDEQFFLANVELPIQVNTQHKKRICREEQQDLDTRRKDRAAGRSEASDTLVHASKTLEEDFYNSAHCSSGIYPFQVGGSYMRCCYLSQNEVNSAS